MATTASLSIIIPARNEAKALRTLLPSISRRFPDSEILVVNDGSSDDTSDVCRETGVREIVHRYGMGNGAAVKTGARSATGEVLGFMDGDGQHDPADIGRLAEELDKGHDMAVGARA